MRRNCSGWVLGLAVTLLAATVGVHDVRAEVSANPSPAGVSMLIIGIIEGPDPIPQVLWEPVRDVDPKLFLNPSGAPRGDGRPDVAIDPVTNWPHVVWAWNNGGEHDIAYSRWTGSEWHPTEILISGTANQVDPRIFVDESTIYVVWWETGVDKVWLVTRPIDGEWQASEPVSQALQTGMRPSVVSWEGTVLVAAEVDDGQGGKQIILATRQGQGVYVTETVGSVDDDHALDVVLHAEQAKLWLDWRQSDQEFGYTQFLSGAWAGTETLPWTDESWLALEEVRRCIRTLVFAP